ncbi:hypothetical protein A3B52_03590 [Candidatus Curtissbacteria bacterium RIFCSPLOWO2_01_FULL_41_28]|nr:MAG: hypothetical protein UT99_C0002G0050 [Candidatus Curtissbacteria bacterium GW2011_GWA2_40_31]OGD78706.1 MAG: hypothetical protein A2683_02030 [Candidatus Curtissbacteria bacterium RIFCSPHIGHO2_01_FULL_34_40]OGD91711.1 MAG: hypothetical protein A3E14_02775 [Candidatus Curtissbacteria bacterium RIFCSPHIGHO2_12_FULL_41_13]OGD95680.1 MAG: hypothetical protein A3B52_03590 [Candidatus Curtissbacteria bacterium RIFCSPLOWO2_01_FULL_41_28]
MRFTVHGSRFTVCVNKKTVNYELSPIRQAQAFGSEAQARRGDPEYIEGSTINWRRRRHGFGLIEFMIVITVFGIAVSAITASYLSFERNQRLKSAAQMLKGDIRLIQNKAVSGDKGTGGKCESNPERDDLILDGWFIKISQDAQSYLLAGYCQDDPSRTESYTVGSKTVNLPRDVKIGGISILSSSVNDVTIFYRSVAAGVSFHNDVAPPFIDTSDNLKNLLTPQSQLTISLILVSDSSKTYNVKIQTSGEVDESK